MKKKNFGALVKKTAAVSLIGVITTLSLAACGNDDSEDGVTKVLVGVSSSFQDVAYYDENGELDGFEVALIREIDNLLPEYEFEFSAADMANTLLGLDTGKLDMGANQFEYSDERNEKYLFGKEGYQYWDTYVTVLADNTDINSFEDLVGKTVATTTTQGATGQIVVKWNEEHPDQIINIEYYGSISLEAIVESFKQGKWDALFWTQMYLDQRNPQFSEDGEDWVKIVGEPVNATQAYFLFSKANDNTALRDAVDEALRQLKENGKLKELSIKYYGGDYTPAAE